MLTHCQVAGISWERVRLTFTVELSVPAERTGDVQFMIIDRERGFPVTTTRVDAERYQLTMNITNFRDRSQVPDGTWRLVPYLDGKEGSPATYDLTALDQLAQDSRTFIYDNNRVAYLIAFGISDDDERPVFLMRSYQMFRNPRPAPNAPRPPLSAQRR